MSTQNSFIDQLLEDQRSKAEAAAQALKETIRSQADVLTQSFREYVGEEYFALVNRPEVKRVIFTNHDGTKVEHLDYDIPAFDDLQLAPMKIEWRNTSGHPGYYGPFKNPTGRDFKTLGEALEDARKRYPEYAKQRLDEQLKPHLHALSWYTRERVETIDEARDHLNQLKQIDPARSENWDAAYQEWAKNYSDKVAQEKERLEEEARRAQEREEKKRTMDEFITALSDWEKETAVTQEFNQAHARAIQAEQDTPITVNLVTFVVGSALSEDGELYVETDKVYARAGADGFWILKTGAQIKYPNITSIELIQTKPSEGFYARKVKRHGVEIFFSPWIPDGLIDSSLSVLVPLPDHPKTPRGLDYADLRRCEALADGLARGEAIDLENDRELDF